MTGSEQGNAQSASVDAEELQAWPEGTPLELLNTSQGLQCSRAECKALGVDPADPSRCACLTLF